MNREEVKRILKRNKVSQLSIIDISLNTHAQQPSAIKERHKKNDKN